MPYINYPEELINNAGEICDRNGLVKRWQPVFFAGIHLYEQGSWQEAFPYLEAAALRGNLIAYEYLQAMALHCPEQLAQSKAQHGLIYQRYESLEHFPKKSVIAGDWVRASNSYHALKVASQQPASKAQAKKLKQLEQSLLAQCGHLVKNQRANELYWRLNPSRLDATLAANLLDSCSVLYRNYLVKEDKKISDVQKNGYLKQLLTLLKAVDDNKENDGTHAMQCAIATSNLVEKRKWHIIAAHLGNAHACMMLTLQDEKEQKGPFHPFWIYRGAALGDHQLINLLIYKLTPHYQHLIQELKLWCQEHIQIKDAPLSERFSSLLCYADNVILHAASAPTIEDLHALRELLEQWQILLEGEELRENRLLPNYHALLCETYLNLACDNETNAQWVQQALHHVSQGLPEIGDEWLFLLYQEWCTKRSDVNFDATVMEQISQQLQNTQYPPFICSKEHDNLVTYVQSLEKKQNSMQHSLDYQYLRQLLDTFFQYHQQGVNPVEAATAILKIFSCNALDMRQMHAQPMQFIQPYLQQLEPQIQKYPMLEAMMHNALLRQGDNPEMHFAEIKRLDKENCDYCISLIGPILEYGIPGVFEPQPQEAACFYKECLTRKLASEYQFLCMNELGKLYLNYAAVGIGKEEAIAYLTECDQQDQSSTYAYNLGLIYVADADTVAQALPFFEKAVLMGDVDAMRRLGILYADINSNYYQPQKALELLLRALAEGDIGSAYTIGIMQFCDSQIHCPEASDYQNWNFLDFLTLAADSQDPHAQYVLAIIFLCGDFSSAAELDQIHNQGQFYLNQAKQNGLSAEVQHVEHMLEVSGTSTLPFSLLDSLLNRDFQLAWKKLTSEESRAQPDNKAIPKLIPQDKRVKESLTPLERSKQGTLLLPQRLQQSVEDFLSQRKLTANDFIQLLRKFCQIEKASLDESAAGSRVTFTHGQRRFTFHPPHDRSETLKEKQRKGYQDFVRSLMPG